MNKRLLFLSLFFFVLFLAWTLLVYTTDVQPIGPDGSAVGFAALNGWFHNLTGVHFWLYNLTDLLSVIPLGLVAGFAILGAVQLRQRKDIKKVDRDILILGAFYILVGAFYAIFEKIELNYRPVLIEGVLEASYPSSTTMLALCVLVTAMEQFGLRIKKEALRYNVIGWLGILTLFMVIGRAVSGVHWLSDIIGGIFLSVALIGFYLWGVKR